MQNFYTIIENVSSGFCGSVLSSATNRQLHKTNIHPRRSGVYKELNDYLIIKDYISSTNNLEQNNNTATLLPFPPTSGIECCSN
jgi:hypothetical protein